jgi:hypothetical protein
MDHSGDTRHSFDQHDAEFLVKAEERSPILILIGHSFRECAGKDMAARLGRNPVYLPAAAEGNLSRLPELARMLAQQRVDVIIAVGILAARMPRESAEIGPNGCTDRRGVVERITPDEPGNLSA